MAKFYCVLLDGNQNLLDREAKEHLHELAETSTLAALVNGKKEVLARVHDNDLEQFLEAEFIWDQSSAKAGRKFFEYVLHNLGVEQQEHVLIVSDEKNLLLREAKAAGLSTCLFAPAEEKPADGVDFTVRTWQELYPIVMEPEELDNVGLKNRKHSF